MSFLYEFHKNDTSDIRGKKKKNVGHISSGKYVLGRGQKGEVSWRWWGVFFFPLPSSVCGVCRLIETCPASYLPLTYIPGTGGWHLATSIAQYPQFPCRWSPKECSSAQREKWTYRLVQQEDELLSSSEAEKKSPFFVVLLLITALCNIRKHTGTPKVLLKLAPFFLVICLEEKKKKCRDNKATNKNRVSALSLRPTKQTLWW